MSGAGDAAGGVGGLCPGFRGDAGTGWRHRGAGPSGPSSPQPAPQAATTAPGTSTSTTARGAAFPVVSPIGHPRPPPKPPHPTPCPPDPARPSCDLPAEAPGDPGSLSPVSTNRKSISLPSSSPNINPPGPPDPTLPPCWGVWAWTGNPLGIQHQVAQTTALSWDGTEKGADGGRRKAGTWAPLWQLRPPGSVAARGGGQTLFTVPFLAVPPPATPGPTTGDRTRPRCQGEGRSPPAPRQLGGAVSVGSGAQTRGRQSCPCIRSQCVGDGAGSSPGPSLGLLCTGGPVRSQGKGHLSLCPLAHRSLSSH